jgi:hypothetical protein
MLAAGVKGASLVRSGSSGAATPERSYRVWLEPIAGDRHPESRRSFGRA